MRSRIILQILFLLWISNAAWAQSPLKYLENTFPELTEIYREDIGKCHAHYIFTVDVSGSMDKFESSVVPCLQRFIQALPNGDKVTVMPFGTNVKTPMGFSGTITEVMKNDLCSNIKNLYTSPNYDQAFKDHTDIHKAINAMSQTLNTNSEYKVNILISVTDFLNNIPIEHPYKRRLTEEEVADMRDRLKAAIGDSYVRSIALELSENGSDNKTQAGYCLDQLQNNIFCVSENQLEIVQIGNSKETINQWFEQLRKEILVVKLTAIVKEENKACEARMETEIDVDGNTEAHITWDESRLYTTMKIDSTHLTQQGFTFLNDTANYGKTKDHELTIRLGQIKHERYGFHKINDSINIGISFPTQFDSELARLNITKPLSGSKASVDKMIFTFPLPLWLTLTICILTILYILGVIKAFIRNKKEHLHGKVTVFDTYGNEVKESKIASCDEITIGKAGTIRVEDVAWQVTIKKIEPSPLLLFKKPYFSWYGTQGFVGTTTGITEGKLNYDADSKATLSCGVKRREITNKVKISLR